ncbi:transposase [Paenibacillus sp. VT-400]
MPRFGNRNHVKLNAMGCTFRCPWRNLPYHFPHWKSVYTRLRRWQKAGI